MVDKHARLAALQRQSARLERRITALTRREERAALDRLLVFAGGLIASLAALSWLDWVGGIVVAAAVVAFGFAIYRHRLVKASLDSHKIWLKLKRSYVARIRLDWANIPAARSQPPPEGHPFATDLDITGERSIHRLMNTAISREGSHRLQHWLLATTPDPGAVARRQALAAELGHMPRFRDRLYLQAALAAQDINRQLDGDRLLAWLDKRLAPGQLRPALLALSALAAITITLFVLFWLEVVPAIWFVSFMIYAAVFLSRWQATKNLFDETLIFADALGKLGAVLGYIERYPYGPHTRVRELCAPLLAAEDRPSKFLRRITRLATAASVQKNPLLWMVVNAILPWDVYVLALLNREKAAVAARLPAWLDVWYELEALNSLANFAYLNPEYSVPAIEPDLANFVFEGEALGHPLLGYGEKVCNDFALKKLGQAVIITGSNMAGKSSFLRTLGVNLALAYAGSVVNARRLRVSLFRLFTCIKVSDSVTDGISYFYAEVRRLKALRDALYADHEQPLFFLIDEIFRGTNNRERLIGSRSYIRGLAGQHGVGVISTHDLELIKLADEIPHIENYHFRDFVTDNRMTFDYTLRPGPSPTTNALTIMRMEGLPVEARPQPAETVTAIDLPETG